MQISFARYAGIFAVLTVILAVLPPMLSMPSALGFATALPPLIAAVVEGNAHSKVHGTRPTGQIAMQGAARMTAVSFGITLLLAGLYNAATQGQLMAQGFAPTHLFIGILLVIAIQFGFNRLGLWLAPQSA